MAEEQDKSSKTEEASEKKIRDAVEKGNTPFSREVNTLASMIAILLATFFFVSNRARDLSFSLSRFLDEPNAIRLDTSGDAVMVMLQVGGAVAAFLLPIVILLLLAGLISSAGQNPPRVVFERVKVQASRISLQKGWTRVFGAQGRVEFAKALFKFASISFVAFMIMQTFSSQVTGAMHVHPAALPNLTLDLATRLIAAVAIASCLLAAADLAWSRHHWRSELRMTKQEVKDEHKQIEGDPLVKAKLRSISRDRARQNMLERVPLATVVITNPTHFAVALRYDADTDPAPVVVARGQDHLALRIREIAAE
ncbi:MAG: EscU/YscU/HrcU family type III secretion system export apparatus switch protein, partial [Hyphomicrobiaceae bacterium]